jgi:hypothetical protein
VTSRVFVYVRKQEQTTVKMCDLLRLVEKIKTPFTPIHKRAIPLIVKGKTQRSAILRNSPDMYCHAFKR